MAYDSTRGSEIVTSLDMNSIQNVTVSTEKNLDRTATKSGLMMWKIASNMASLLLISDLLSMLICYQRYELYLFLGERKKLVPTITISKVGETSLSAISFRNGLAKIEVESKYPATYKSSKATCVTTNPVSMLHSASAI